MATKKILKKKLKLSGDDTMGDINNIFNNILNVGNIDINNAYPKAVKLIELINNHRRIVNIMKNSMLMQQMPQLQDELVKYDQFIQEVIDHFIFSNKEEDQNDFRKKFAELLNHKITAMLIETYNNLIPYRVLLESSAISIRFILNMPGVEWIPLPFTTINFKTIVQENNKNIDEFVFLLLSKLYNNSKEFYEIYTKPDYDITAFQDFILTCIDKLEKEIPRCRRAFNKIRNSTKLLKNNFSNYYKDYIQSNNPTIIMENFILDVSTSEATDWKLLSEFRTIIQFYKSRSKNTDPKISNLINIFNSKLGELGEEKEQEKEQNNNILGKFSTLNTSNIDESQREKQKEEVTSRIIDRKSKTKDSTIISTGSDTRSIDEIMQQDFPKENNDKKHLKRIK